MPMNSTIDPLFHAPLSTIVGVLQWMRYTAATGPIILIYDTLLTLDDEMRLVWPGPLSLTKALYYINRYLSIFAITYSNYQISGFHPPLSKLFCQTWAWSTTIVYVVRITTATGMLCLRVAALYNHVRWVIWSLWVGFAIFHGMRLGLNFFGAYWFAANVTYSHIGGQCLPGSLKQINRPVIGIIAGVVPTTFDLFLLALTMAKVLKNTALLDSRPSSPIIRALLSHEILYFFVIAIIRISGTILPVAFPPAAGNVEWGLESALISRFFLHLRSVFNESPSFGESETAISTLSPVRTHSFWSRENRLSTGFSVGLGPGTSIYSEFPNKNKTDILQEEAVGVEVAMELQTRHHGDNNDVKLAADITPA